MSPNTRLVTLVRVRLKSFLCKYYFSRMSKFHSSFSLDFFLAQFPKHISFSKQSWQEGVTPSPSCSCNRLGVQLPTVTSFLVSKPTSSCSCCWGRVGRREHEKGAHTQREELVHSPAEAGAPLSWSLGESHSVNRHSWLSVVCWGLNSVPDKGPAFRAHSQLGVQTTLRVIKQHNSKKPTCFWAKSKRKCDKYNKTLSLSLSYLHVYSFKEMQKITYSEKRKLQRNI